MKKIIAKKLLEIGAVFLRLEEPFTWASGIKSPIYCDNRLILSAPEVRNVVELAIADTISNEYPDCEIIMGTSTAGIAHAAIAGHILEKPVGYVRSGTKDHGRTNKIEGKLNKGDKVVIVEDLISTAGSAIQTAEALREAGGRVLGIVSIFTYGMKRASDNLTAARLKNISLSDLDSLISVAAKEKYIREDQIQEIIDFRDNPEDVSWMKGEK